MTTPRTNPHWCRLQPGTLPVHPWPRVTRSVCSCGWVSDWLRSASRAVDVGLVHTGTAVERND